MIPYGRQDLTEDDIAAVVDVLRSDFLTQGPAVPSFERAVANYVSGKHAIAVNSATAALHIACLALELGPGDELWTSPITFVASANCARYCGAKVDFVDIDPKTYNLDVTALRAKLIAARIQGRLPKIVVAVHLCGQSCDMESILALSQEFSFRVIEDASHAIGGRYLGNQVGGCQFSDVTVFSFHPVKIITTGEGGIAVTNSADLANRMRLLRSHGITRDPSETTHIPDGAWYYQQLILGFNYRLTDIQAALGSSQLLRIDSYIKARRRLAARYDSLLAELPIGLPWQLPETESSFHLYIVRIGQLAGTTRDVVFDSMRKMGIGVNVHYIPLHLQPYYAALGFKPGDYPIAEKYYEEAISLPLFATLSIEQQDAVVLALQSAIR
ncbi:UDP-4-amino-4,6-dideoxy-N-acetyl-beta-L-altrosamine transaminase [Cupriavidus sp. AcVe19-6a]|uniref:UDP-4-amino-4, 6-dideoxy-N-acetyl-beta-L-altrosamine transaminase n=1 Tax=Cupriavidus sp. AcVe19-6a TaxID=2821358 RepID=UPI001AE91B0E|nr:UDP-4-amino-4,6-dideoxy-N-acetyl-beta-L-altrosamine transaminase [Cupriavidus sp. AcVe19-6a]MBP0639833.1 UDP-4-amino-4,6-dideoxy-N-acetyl-beta-L-altrosamine transaminase [Cupriavidus sp. AcVe19-6a]